MIKAISYLPRTMLRGTGHTLIRDIIFRADETPEIAEYSYVFDSKGNWIQKTETFTDFEGNQLAKPRTETRTIEYW